MSVEIVYLGRDNTIDLLLKADGVAQSLEDVTKIDLILDDEDETTISDTDADAWPIKWAPSETGTTGKIMLRLGGESGLSAGNYTATLVLYDPTNSNGVVWGTFPLRVES